ncbi:MAG: GUN4 domain-containing protein, partial [Trichodesmium sp. MO_231.B1]|nr:GUN4 domain-containing protein [Trichodesmium sp. MO_231.B1]
KFTAITLRYPRLLLELKNNNQLLADLEKDAVDKSLPSNNSIILTPESTPNDQETENANYWLKNYPKIKQLLCFEMTLKNEQKSGKKYIFENALIKKLLEVSPQGIPPKCFKLREFLAAKKWKEADIETYRVMLQVAGREEEGWLRMKDIEKFPCEDFRTIDQLWVKYSDGKFGFSVQKKIYESLGGTRKYNKEIYEQFGKKVGWRDEKGWLSYPDLVSSLKMDYRGLFPARPFALRLGPFFLLAVPFFVAFVGGRVFGFFCRAETCRL